MVNIAFWRTNVVNSKAFSCLNIVHPNGKCNAQLLGQTAVNCDGSAQCTCKEVKRGKKIKYRYGDCQLVATTVSTTVETTTTAAP